MNSLRQALDAARQYYRRGEWQQAEQLCLQALKINPDQIDVLHLLGVIAGQTGRYSRATEYLQAVLRLQPELAAAHNDLGNVFAIQGKFVAAVASFGEAVRLQPDFAGAHYNLANALCRQGRLTEAVASLQQAVRIEPKYAEAHLNLGLACLALARFSEAQASFRQAVRLRPHDAGAHYHLGYALLQEGQATAFREPGKLAEAIASFQRAHRLKADFAEAHVGLGYAFLVQGRLDDAVAAFRAGLQIKPEDSVLHSSLLMTLHYHSGYDAAAIFDESRRWDRQHAEPLRKLIQLYENVPDRERRLRIGYVSPDFRDHATSYCTIPLLSNHDHRRFEIFCYADVARPDAFTDRLRGYADVWRGTAGLADEKLADLVRGHQIDILVDLSQHSAQNRLLVFARKPAPVQVTWLGYVGTTGLSAIDYRLSDPYLDPPGLFDAFYAEESLRLPETFWCYDPLTGEPPVNALPATAAGVLTFGCLNNSSKVNDDCLALWAEVLLAVPRSRLLLLAPAGSARDHVADTLERLGIASQRLRFTDRLARPQYLELYHQIDVGLDPLPFNGHITSLDALWMGVLPLTLVSKKTAVGRGGFSQLCNLGLGELAAETPEEFVALAVRLAGDLARLVELRGTLRRRMEQSPLMDGQRFARHVEHAYRQMWHRWCQEQRQHKAV